MTTLLTAAAVSCVLLALSRQANRPAGLASPAAKPQRTDAEDPTQAPVSAASSGPMRADVSTAMQLALKRLAPVMAKHAVQADLAIPPGLVARLRATALADLLEELLGAAVHAAPASRLLLTAAPRGDRVYITVTDDIPGADPAVRLASVRGLMQRVALCGGALDVDVCLHEGTSMTLRFTAVTTDRQDKPDQTAADRLQSSDLTSMTLNG